MELPKKLPSLTDRSLDDIKSEIVKNETSRSTSRTSTSRRSAASQAAAVSSEERTSRAAGGAAKKAGKKATRKAPRKAPKRAAKHSAGKAPEKKTREQSRTGDSARLRKAAAIVESYRKGAIWAGLVPVPIVDALGTGYVQLRMLRELSALYEIPFKNNIGKAVISTFAGTAGPQALSFGGVSLLKLAPGPGLIASCAGMAVLSGIATRTMGRLFVQHFESGGTLLTLDAAKLRQHYYDTIREESKAAGR